MKKTIITFIKYTLPLIFAFLLVRYLLTKVSMDDIVATFKKADYRWFLLSSFFAIIAHWSRGYRWKLLLQPLGHNPKTQNGFLAVMIGYFANFALPRIGEVARCGVLRTTDNVPMEAGVGTVVAERVFDLIMLLLVTAFTFFLEFDKVNNFFINRLFKDKVSGFQSLIFKPYLLVAIAAIFIILFLIFYFLRHKLFALPFVIKTGNFIKGIWKGVLSVAKLEKKGAFIVSTLLIWAMYYLSTYVLLFALPQTAELGWRAAFVIFIVGTFAMAAPVQGGFGTFHALVGEALVFYGLSERDGIVLATFMHTSQVILLFSVGIICTTIYGIILLKQNQKTKAVIVAETK